MKKTKLFATVITLCIAISTLAYGVYAAANLSFTVGANVAFVVDNLFFELQMNIKGAYDSNGNPLGTLNYNYNTIGVEDPSVTYSDSTRITSELLDDWADGLNLNQMYFNPGALTPIEFEIIVINHTPNKGILVTIGETTAIKDNGVGDLYNITKASKVGVCNPLTGANTTADTQDSASWTYTLDSLTQRMDLTFDWNVHISEIELTFYEDAELVNADFQVVDGFNAIITGTSIVTEEQTSYTFKTCYVDTSTNKYYMLHYISYDEMSMWQGINVTSVVIPKCCKHICWDGEETGIYNVIISENINKVDHFHSIHSVTFQNSDYLTLRNNNVYSKDEMSFLKLMSNQSQADLIGVKVIGENAFDFNTLISSITLPNTLKVIKDYAFWYCTTLASIEIPNSVTAIESYAFGYCSSLTLITIGNNITSVGQEAFDGTAYYNNTNNWTDNVLYLTARDGVTKYLIDAKTDISGSYVIDSNTKLISVQAFEQCRSLSSIYIPSSVINIGKWIFYSCSSGLIINCQATSKLNGWDTDWDLRGYNPIVKHTNINWGVSPS